MPLRLVKSCVHALWRMLGLTLLGLLSFALAPTLSSTYALQSSLPVAAQMPRVEACAGATCKNGEKYAIVLNARRGQQSKSRGASASVGSARTATAPGGFEFVRSQVCGGPGYVPEGGTGCGDAGCVDSAATRFITARRAVGGNEPGRGRVSTSRGPAPGPALGDIPRATTHLRPHKLKPRG